MYNTYKPLKETGKKIPNCIGWPKWEEGETHKKIPFYKLHCHKEKSQKAKNTFHQSDMVISTEDLL